MTVELKIIEKMLDILVAFRHGKEYMELLNVMLTKMMEMTNADGGTLYIIEDGKLHFYIMRTESLNVHQSGKENIMMPPISLDENNIHNISAYAAIKNEIICIDDVYFSEEFNFNGPKNYDQMTGYRTGSMLVFPLTTGSGDNGTEEVIGVIQLINSIDEVTGAIMPFQRDEEFMAFLRAVANISANTLANLTYSKEIKELFNSFVRVMTKAIDERSPYSVNHTNNVASACTKFAAWLSMNFPLGHSYHFSESRLEQLAMAALLHDIGKIITPLEIMDKPDRLGSEMAVVRLRFEVKKQQLENSFLKKDLTTEEHERAKAELSEALELVMTVNTAPFLDDEALGRISELASFTYADETSQTVPLLTPLHMDALMIRKGTLTDAERQIMQEHVSVTARLLEQMSFNRYYRDVPVYARSHHEFLNGSGYPLNLSGSDIPLEACILTIMDIYDALIAHDRPYKKPLPPDRAFDVLEEMAQDGQLHSELVRLFKESKVWEEVSE